MKAAEQHVEAVEAALQKVAEDSMRVSHVSHVNVSSPGHGVVQAELPFLKGIEAQLEP